MLLGLETKQHPGERRSLEGSALRELRGPSVSADAGDAFLWSGIEVHIPLLGCNCISAALQVFMGALKPVDGGCKAFPLDTGHEQVSALCREVHSGHTKIRPKECGCGPEGK